MKTYEGTYIATFKIMKVSYFSKVHQYAYQFTSKSTARLKSSIKNMKF